MGTAITLVIILASLLLVFVVYVQNPKGGGLSSDFGSAQQLGGVQKTNDFIDKATWSLAALVGVLSIVLTIMNKTEPIVNTVEEEPTEQTPGDNPQPQGANSTSGAQ